jgi:hypothetical protein
LSTPSKNEATHSLSPGANPIYYETKEAGMPDKEKDDRKDKGDDKGHFKFKVNGDQVEVESQYITARKILEFAKLIGAIPGNPEDYVLEGDKGRYVADQLVDLLEDNVFIAIRTTPTPVA